MNLTRHRMLLYKLVGENDRNECGKMADRKCNKEVNHHRVNPTTCVLDYTPFIRVVTCICSCIYNRIVDSVNYMNVAVECQLISLE